MRISDWSSDVCSSDLFDKALTDAGVDRAAAYVTNAVKHFKFERRGKRRIHQKPDTGEIAACRWWLEQEQALIRPPVTVALGATAEIGRASCRERVGQYG